MGNGCCRGSGANAVHASAPAAGDHEDAAVVLDASVEDGDVAAGEEIYQGVCKNCHGPTAKGMASFPKLAGLAPEHLVARLAHRTGLHTTQPALPGVGRVAPIIDWGGL